jgi:tRNA threonylcarbamoyl adenosine modification protein (Sua5/YciO/YrdC/YwlC family)
MALERLELHPKNPNKRTLQYVAQKLNEGKIIIFPTDTIYAMGCLYNQKSAIEQISRILGKKEKQNKMSLICSSISVITAYTKPFSNDVFKTMKRYLPGPYTFILHANQSVQKFFKHKKDEIGIRIPDNEIIRQLSELLEVPIISTSLSSEDEIRKYYTDPDEIEEVFKHDVDILIDGGSGEHTESTVLDCTGSEIIVVREGKGDIE